MAENNNEVSAKNSSTPQMADFGWALQALKEGKTAARLGCKRLMPTPR